LEKNSQDFGRRYIIEAKVVHLIPGGGSKGGKLYIFGDGSQDGNIVEKRYSLPGK